MSDHNNIYNIMGKLNALTPQEETPKEAAQRIYESVEARGSVLAGVKSVEANLNEKYMGFKKTVGALKKQDGIKDPEALAASIGRKKYGKTAFQKAAAAGKKMGEGMDEARGGDTNFGSTVSRGESWVVHKDGKLLKKFKSHTAAKAFAEKNGAKCNSSSYWHDHFKTNEERETLKTKGGTIYKGGKYGTEYDAGDDGEKKKPKTKAKDGERKGRGRPKAEKPASFDAPKGDIFGRTTGEAPKGKKGTVIKGKGNQDTVDEAVTVDKLEKSYAKHMDRANNGGGDKERSRAVKTLYVGGADKAEKAYNQYQKKKAANVAEGKAMLGKSLMESVNFKKMMDECDMTADEMLESISQDIQAYKATGDMSNRLRDFMHLHNHMKKIEMEAAPQGPSFAPQMPSGQDVLPQQSTLGKIGSTVKKAFTGPDDAELLAQLHQDSKPTTVDEELNELAKLAGITDEGNAFTGKLHDTPKGGEFELDGEEYTDTSNLDESKTSLEDIARLSGIFQEGKDYGDTTYNEPPTYDNTPDEHIEGEDVMLKGGDGEVAGKEKPMRSTKPTFKNGDNPLAETKAILKPAAEFNFVKEMGRDLMKAYQDIKTK